MNKAINYKDLVGQETTVTLTNGAILELREFNAEDWSWMQEKFGESYSKKLNNLEIKELAMIIFRILKDKTKYTASEEDGFDDDGRPVKQFVSGPTKLLRAMNGGITDVRLVTEGLLKSFGLPNPDLFETEQKLEKKSQ